MRKQIFTLALSGVLGIGVAVAVPVPQDQSGSSSGHQGMGHRMDPDQLLQRLTKQLTLTSDQQSQIKPILENRQQQMHSIMQDESLQPQDRREKMRSVMEDTSSKIKAVLTDDQKAKYEQMQQRQRQRWQERQQNNGNSDNGGSH